MAFLTKITVVGLLAIGSLASPSPINDDKTLIARTLCSSDVDANFDGLKPVISVPPVPASTELPVPIRLPATNNLNIVPTPYKQLDWNGGFRYITSAPVNHSPPAAAVFDGATQALKAPRISTYGTVQYFTFQSVYLGCFLQTQGAALQFVACTITATGTKTNGQTVSKDFKYTPDGLKQFVLPSEFANLKSVVFGSNLLTTLLTAVIVDDAKFKIYKPC